MVTAVKAVRIHNYGDAGQLRYEEIYLEPPGEGEVRIRHRAIGLNFADIHNRTGRYKVPSLPHVLGGEAAGVVEEVGPGVSLVKPGDRVVYAAGGPNLPPGAYAEARNYNAERLVLLPDEIDDETAAAMMTKGLTAQYLLKASFPVKSGDTIVVHAAAGGVGLLLVQWARLLGCRVIGIVSTEEKAQLAADHGCHHPLVLHRGGGFAERVRALTAGEGVSVVYDSVGRDTFEESLRCLRPNATLVSFGSASGPVPPFDLFQLNQMGSLHVTSAAFAWFLRDRRELLCRAADLFDVVLRGAVRIAVNQRYPLADAAHAHRDLEARRTTGFSVLLP